MKLIFAQYLASLKERDELDAILPDLLSELGLNVTSKPSLGSKQYGVDVVAEGKFESDVDRIFLVSIKAGDLRRSDWDSNPNALRQSLNQIIDTYIPKFIAASKKHLPIVVVICLGGDVHQTVQVDVDSYIDKNSSEEISFEVWNGDRLADMLLSGVLRENTLPEDWRNDFRKSVAFVDEPDVSFRYFSCFIENLVDGSRPEFRMALRAVRQIYVAVWTLYVWARDAQNLEAAFLASEKGLILSWHIARSYLETDSNETAHLRDCILRLTTLHRTMLDDYVRAYVAPRAPIFHGLTSAIASEASLDLNLRMFDILGRVACKGLWALHDVEMQTRCVRQDVECSTADIRKTAEILEKLIANNPILFTPIKDSHAIDITLACLFLRRCGRDKTIQSWVQHTTRATIFAYLTHDLYPCIFEDYRDLVDHPKGNEAYRERATMASTLFPTLAIWAALVGDQSTLDELARFVSNELGHSTMQLWFPKFDTIEHFFLNREEHGVCLADINIEQSSEQLIEFIKTECFTSDDYISLRNSVMGYWPLIALVSRHYRRPVVPHLWALAQ